MTRIGRQIAGRYLWEDMAVRLLDKLRELVAKRPTSGVGDG
jgi:hypothetical protein